MTVFHIAHLSDLHFGATSKRGNLQSAGLRRKASALGQGNALMPATHDPRCAEQLAAALYQHEATLRDEGDSLDLLIVSGDLGTTGMQGDLEAAQSYLEAQPSQFWFRRPAPGESPLSPDLATIKGIAQNHFYIPGNHDRYVNNHHAPGCARFNAVFATLWADSVNGVRGIRLLKSNNPGGILGPEEQIAILGVDGCLRDESGASRPRGIFKKGQGRLYADTLQELDRQTKDVRQRFPGIVVIWVVHFPPHDHVQLLLCMRDFQPLAAAAQALDVAVILSGHTHLHQIYPPIRGGQREVWNAGSATQFLDANGNWFCLIDVEITNNTLVGLHRVNYRYNSNTDAFAYDSREDLDLP